MASTELVLTINPKLDKQSIRIDKAKYNVVRETILKILRSYGSMTFTQLGALVEGQLQNDFDGPMMWYYTTVKLDMEARGEIRRVPNSRPQVVEIV